MIEYASTVPCFSQGGRIAHDIRLVTEHVLLGVRLFVPRVAGYIRGSDLHILLFIFFLNSVPHTLNYLFGISINFVKFFVLIARECSELYIL